MFVYQGRTALVTGAWSGIGRSFARSLAARGMSVILTARSLDALNSLASEISAEYKVRAEAIQADLSQPSVAAQLATEITNRGYSIDLLVNNAGFLTHGHFENIPSALEHAEVMVNMGAMVELCHAFLPSMLQRKSGGIINVASIAGFQPIPYMAVYAATKAFVISFSVALREECRDRNVRVLAICPGTTDTPFFDVANAPEAALGKKRTPDQVVATALRGLDRGKSLVVDGTMNSLLTLGPRLIPRWLAARFAGRAVLPRGTKAALVNSR